MKVIAITEENLEDLLAYDDIFLDYFNAFLGLPVFPQAVAYNRLTGSFEEVERVQQTVSESGDVPVSPLYGATDVEREVMLQWAKEHRLPLFLRTELFREFKLCKLLLRSLDDRYSARDRSSDLLRGYSRQTESYISSLSNSGDNSGNDIIDEGFDIASWSDVYQCETDERLESRARSLPVGAQFGIQDTSESDHPRPLTKYHTTGAILPKAEHSALTHKKSGVTRFSERVETIPDDNSQDGRHNNEMLKDETPESFIVSRDTTSTKKLRQSNKRKSVSKECPYTPNPTVTHHTSLYARAVSAPVNYEEYLRQPAYRDFDAMFGELEPADDGTRYVLFEEEGMASEQQTDADVKSMEGRHKMTYQQLKEHVLSCCGGMELITRFLSNTAGRDLLNFWLDCENFKDAMEDYDEVTNMEKRNRLYRDIQDKYRMTLSADAKNQITKSASRPNVSLSHTIFIRTQYDILRRLRTYWLPRFLTHLEYTDDVMLQSDADDEDFRTRSFGDTSMSQSIFPSISLVKSLPVNPDDVLQLTKHNSWDMVCRGRRLLDEKVTCVQIMPSRSVVTTAFGPLKERLLIAMTSDNAAGGPFRRFLDNAQDPTLLWSLLFWQDITDYGRSEDRSADRLLRLAHAWTIFTKYIAVESFFSIGLSPWSVISIAERLNESRDFIEGSIFDPARTHAVRALQDSWLRYLKEDLKTFLDCRVKQDASGSPPSTAEMIDIAVTDDNQLVITRPRPWVKRYPPSSPSERGRRLRRALSVAESINEERRTERKKAAQERRKEMEKERRKAIRAAKQRQKEAKTVKVTQRGEANEFSTIEADDAPRDKPLNFVDIMHHKQLMQIFKKYVQESETRDTLNLIQLHHDISSYHNSPASKDKQKKDVQANYIYKTYIDAQARKFMSFPEKIQAKISADKDRPKSATLKDMQAYSCLKIDESFKAFLESQAQVLGMDAKVLSCMSVSEISLRIEPDPSLSTSWKKKTRGGKVSDLESPDLPEFSTWMRLAALSLKELYKMLNERRKQQTHEHLFDYVTTSKSTKKSRKETGRAQPNKDDRVELLLALNQSAVGEMPLRMLYFYKYLGKHGENDSMPLVHKDLLFYIEILKFKECSHVFSDEELLRRKVQSLHDCFLESQTPPSLQVDLPSDIQVRAIRAAQKYVGGKDMSSAIFDEAQFTVFKELLPYWAGFRKSYMTPKSKEKPVTRIQKLLKKRLESIENYKIPKPVVSLPAIQSSNMAAVAFTFSLNEGIKMRIQEGGTEEALPSRDGRRTSFDPYRKKRQSTLGGLSNVGDASRRSSVFVR